VSEIAVINRSRLSDTEVAFMTAGCDLQLREHFLPLWEGVEYTPIRFYSNEKDLPLVSDLVRLMVIADVIDEPGALGYHTMDPMIHGIVLAQSDGSTSSILSHEILEMAVDPPASRWTMMPDGRYVAEEICDPVEADYYLIDVEIFGDKKPVLVSDFVTPAWFLKTGLGPYSYLDRAPAPFMLAPGGYMIVREGHNIYDVWAAKPDASVNTVTQSAITRARKVWSRTSRLRARGVR